MPLLWRIEQYLKRSAMPPTRFGRQVVHDPRFVFDLRNGREPGHRVTARVLAWLEANGAEMRR
jgi:hypothetical protein